jgi:peptide deformylase
MKSGTKKTPAEIQPLEVVKYGHPALRSKGVAIKIIDDAIVNLVEEMIVTMYEEEGCGLAAQQVGRSLQLAVVDVMPAMEDRPSYAWVDGREIELDSLMPLVMINPEVKPVGEGRSRDTEGCLSIPGIQDEVDRPARVRVICKDLSGSTLDFEAEGLLARAAQHEIDHLNGILFIDHLSPESLEEHLPQLRKLQAKALEF